ncbi:Delta(12)-fatty-acid desaturase [Acaryochloris thomasi RCC1774]|uniref:Delta(12)-fatty-acid desaturase n=1 Tax=Acaryochloris thomasi RCC1774 TaxID=1764569 RepID=A0A2W1JLH3_9CYAN|nr:fatty acid desaturase [Acaryochloris thomasi]PZD74203.1 Delta(12)-fatty-acid desaturase [Acaryochloris thomasi RCC1774]
MTASLIKPESKLRSLDNPEVTMQKIIQSLPKACFEKNARKAWTEVVVTVLGVALGYAAIVFSPWYLLPFAWFFTGTALTGFFVIGHDCAHRSFAKKRWVNDVVGHICMMPLIYPFHGWRIMHNFHHVHTNELDVDNAWRPFSTEEYDGCGPVVAGAYKVIRGRLWWIGSIIHWFNLHFDWRQYDEKDQADIKLSVAVVVLFGAIAFPTLILTTGVWGFIKFWLLPWMGYHFWMSTFTLVHHTAPDVAFKPTDEWNPAEAQLVGSIHCDYPWWITFLCHDINVHIPHHVSTAIPSYNLRMAHESLKENWGEYVCETKFDLELIKTITDDCHLYEPEKAYQSFKEHQAKAARS